jgi:2'-5' RNA ligase
LIGLQKRVDQALAPSGFPLESRDFHPHLTLGRVKSHEGRDALLQALKTFDAERFGEWKLEELNLMQSVLQSGGSVYTKLWTMKAF